MLLEDNIAKILSSIKEKDIITYNHVLNVAFYSKMIGIEFGLNDTQLNLLYLGGLLHDIGKVFIPDSILKKNSSLNSEEIKIMKRHTIYGSNEIPNNHKYKVIREIIRSHHERMDGTGYPDNLKGEEIPLYVKIVSVADSFDAMTSKRNYNRAKTIEEAIEELRICSTPTIDSHGILRQQFDPLVVEKFISSLNKNIALIKSLNK